MQRNTSRRLCVEQLESRFLLSTYYVATSGSDNNNGSQGSPFATIQHAMIVLEPGDVLDVEQGSYAGWITGWDDDPASGGDPYGYINGTAGSPITIQADPSAPAGSVIINSRNKYTAVGIDFERGNYITIANLTVNNDYTGGMEKGIKICGTDDQLLGNSVIDVSDGLGILDIGTDTLIEGNTVTGTTGSGDQGHGIYLSGDVAPQVIGNVIYDNHDIGIHVNGEGGATGVVSGALISGNYIYQNLANGINCDGIENSTIENNLIYDNQDNGIALYQETAGGPSSGNLIVDNTIYTARHTAGACITLTNDAHNNTILNNILLNTAENVVINASFSDGSLNGLVCNYNVIWTNGDYENNDNGSTETLAQWQAQTGQDENTFTSTPAALWVNVSGFGDAPDNNYQLNSTSPAIGAGTSTDAPSTDILGNPRPSTNGYDIGTYEYQPNMPGLTLSSEESSVTAGNLLSVTLTATVAGVTDIGFRGTIHFTSSDSQAGLPSDYTFTSADQGVHTFNVTLKTAGSQSITATDTFVSSDTTSTSVTVDPAAASTLVVSDFPASTTAGAGHYLKVTAKDPYGNIATGYAGTVHFTSNDPKAVLPSDYTFTTTNQGVKWFKGVTLETYGSHSITVTDQDSLSTTITRWVRPGPATHLVLLKSGTVIAGTPFTLTVIAYDQFGNKANGYQGTIQFTSDDPNPVLPSDYTFVGSDGGRHVFTLGVVLTKSAMETVTATDVSTSTITGSVSTWVKPGVATHFRIIAPATVTAGVAFSITVIALDQYGNKANGYLGTIYFSSTDPAASLPADYQFTSADCGKHVFIVTLGTVGTWAITTTDLSNPSISGTDPTINVVASAPDLPSAVVGDSGGDAFVRDVERTCYRLQELIALTQLRWDVKSGVAATNPLDLSIQELLEARPGRKIGTHQALSRGAEDPERLAAIGALFASLAFRENRAKAAEMRAGKKAFMIVRDKPGMRVVAGR